MKFIKEFFGYLPVILLKGVGVWLVIGLILDYIGIDILYSEDGPLNIAEMFLPVIIVGSAIHYFQKFRDKNK